MMEEVSLQDIHFMFYDHQIAQIKLLINQDPTLATKEFENDSHKTLLLLAIEHNNLTIVSLLLDKGAVVATQPKNAIEMLLEHCYEPKGSAKRVGILKLLAKHGAPLPTLDDNKSCYIFIQNTLNFLYRGADLAVAQQLHTQGLDFAKAEQQADNSIVLQCIRHNHYEDLKRTESLIEFMCDIGCQIFEERSYDGSTIKVAFNHHLYGLTDKWLDMGLTFDKEGGDLFFAIAEDHKNIPEALCKRLIGDEPNINRKCSYGQPGLHKAVCYSNNSFIRYFAKNGGDLNAVDEDGETALTFAVSLTRGEQIKLLIELGADLNLLTAKGRTALDIAKTKTGIKRVTEQLIKAGAKTSAELAAENGDANPLDSITNLIEPGEAWVLGALDGIKTLNETKMIQMELLINHCLENNSPKPSAKWLKQANTLVDNIGSDWYQAQLLSFLPLVKQKRIDDVPHDEDYGDYDTGHEDFISENNARLLKGLLWTCSRYDDSAMCQTLRQFAVDFYKKVYGIGMRSAKLANAALLALAKMPADAGLKEIIVLRAATKYNPALVHINRIFDKIASDRDISSDELADLSVPDYGLTQLGGYRKKIGAFTALIKLAEVGKCEFTWATAEKSQKSVPATISKAYPDQVKTLKAMVKELNTATSAHIQRIEKLYLRDGSLDISTWTEQYIDHKLVGFLARRLIWRVVDDNTTLDVIYSPAGFVNVDNQVIELPPEANVTLWHPILCDAQTVLAWRNWMVAHEIRQPFKQAHREIYVLTDAEKKTATYSERFANHILGHQQFHALTEQRGWQQTRGGQWDGGQENSATKKLKNHNIMVEFDAEGIDEFGTTDSGIYQYVGTGKVYFHSDKAIKLSKLPPLLFSELMRDIDLFVGVCSVANDPQWQYQERDYWQNQSFGKLSNMAQTRKEVLTALLPKLKIAAQLSIEDRFLVVKGTKTHYKIHLGSSNILMAPNDRYLCIVQSRSKVDVLLPFEGDIGLSQILSKAMMLANDHKIKDQT
ncbi:MAG: ankyrin repeat protein, partial [Phenylobacterium sp.]